MAVADFRGDHRRISHSSPLWRKTSLSRTAAAARIFHDERNRRRSYRFFAVLIRQLDHGENRRPHDWRLWTARAQGVPKRILARSDYRLHGDDHPAGDFASPGRFLFWGVRAARRGAGEIRGALGRCILTGRIHGGIFSAWLCIVHIDEDRKST